MQTAAIVRFYYLCNMKGYIFSLFALLSLQFAHADDLYRWKPIDTSFDALATQCEEANVYDTDRRKLASAVEAMVGIAKAKGSKQLMARALFWDTWQKIGSPIDSALLWNERAIALTDTVAYRYDYQRMLLSRAGYLRMKGKYLESYALCKKVGEAWLWEKDWFDLAKAEVQLGAMLGELGEYALSLRYFRQAGDHFKLADNNVCETKNRLNICTALYYTNDIESARNILIQLAEDPVTKGDTSFYVNVLASLASMPGRNIKEWTLWGWQLSKKTGDPQLISLSASNMGSLMLEENINDEALHYYRLALANCFASAQRSQYNIYRGLAEAFKRLGQSDSAAYYEQRERDTQAAIASQKAVSDMEKSSVVQKINRLEAESQRTQDSARRNRLALYCIVAVLAIALTVTVMILIRVNKKRELIRHNNHKLQRAFNKTLGLPEDTNLDDYLKNF